ncbi:hypothetical protein JCM3766R1_005957 [Sporobolomyces carnicolor]
MAGHASSDDGDDGVYVVEAIMASRYDHIKKEWRYLIKWQGYSSRDNTWEPASNLNCPDLLAAYEADQAEKGTPLVKPDSKSAKRGRKSVPSDSKSKSPASNSKGKARAQARETRDEDSSENESSIAELDKRRAEAKKKAAKQPRTSIPRAEEAVASKWEQKAEKKTPAKEGTPRKLSSALKPQSKSSSSAHSGVGIQDERKRPMIRDESDSETDVAPPAKRPTVNPESSANPSITSSSLPADPATTSQSAPVASRSDTAPAASTALRAMQFKRKPPVEPHKSPLRPTSSNGDSSTMTDHAHPATPATIGQSIPVDDTTNSAKGVSGQRHLASSQRPSVRFAEDAESSSRQGSELHGRHSSESSVESETFARAAAAAAEAEAENRRQTLTGLENRLTSSEFYRRTPVFEEKALPAACAEAVHVDHGTVLRMKGRGTAIICDSRDQMVSGEGIALGLLLMMIGARMPKQLGEVAVVCVHRRETLGPIEAMYNELVNMQSHHVEFLHFGDNLPIQPILISGFLIIPSLTALQQGMALQAFCEQSRERAACNSTVVAHPASIVLARSRLPQWQKISNTLVNNHIPIVEKHELSLSSPFVGLDKPAYLTQGLPTEPLPFVTTDSEIDEICGLLQRKREQEPTRWRRFVVVVDQVDPKLADKTKNRGIELCTWVRLTELTRECLF